MLEGDRSEVRKRLCFAKGDQIVDLIAFLQIFDLLDAKQIVDLYLLDAKQKLEKKFVEPRYAYPGARGKRSKYPVI